MALGIIGRPDLLFLDEPTTGFDPSARRGAWEVVTSLASSGTTIVLTTHYMDEAQHLADRIAVINHGAVVAEGTPDTIGGRSEAATRIRFTLPDGIALADLPVPAGDDGRGGAEVVTDDEVRVLHALTGWALDRGLPLDGLRVDRPTLEDVYLELTHDPSRVMNVVSLSFHQLKYEQKTYWRNPTSAVFTFAFPIIFLVIFASLNRAATVDFLGGLSYNQFFVPGIITFGIIAATYTNLAMTLSIRRDSFLLKRLRGTPLPASALLGGLLLNAFVVSVILTALTAGVGIVVYDVTFPGHWLALFVTLGVGASTFCAIGVALCALIPNADAAPAIVNGVLFPVLFLSGVFFPLESGTVLANVADIFPVRHLVQAMFTAFDPRLAHGIAHGWAGWDLAVLAAWCVGATIVAVRNFRWEPRAR